MYVCIRAERCLCHAITNIDILDGFLRSLRVAFVFFSLIFFFLLLFFQYFFFISVLLLALSMAEIRSLAVIKIHTLSIKIVQWCVPVRFCVYVRVCCKRVMHVLLQQKKYCVLFSLTLVLIDVDAYRRALVVRKKNYIKTKKEGFLSHIVVHSICKHCHR